MTKNMINAAPVDNKDLWQTPDHIFNSLDQIYNFTLDPCCDYHTALCGKFYTPVENGLIQSWSGESVFVNPPYSRYNIDNWVDKCFEEMKTSEIIALLPVSTSADWFQKLIGQSLYFVDKRIRFKGAPYTAPFSSVIVRFNNENKNYSFRQ